MERETETGREGLERAREEVLVPRSVAELHPSSRIVAFFHFYQNHCIQHFRHLRNNRPFFSSNSNSACRLDVMLMKEGRLFSASQKGEKRCWIPLFGENANAVFKTFASLLRLSLCHPQCFRIHLIWCDAATGNMAYYPFQGRKSLIHRIWRRPPTSSFRLSGTSLHNRGDGFWHVEEHNTTADLVKHDSKLGERRQWGYVCLCS